MLQSYSSAAYPVLQCAPLDGESIRSTETNVYNSSNVCHHFSSSPTRLTKSMQYMPMADEAWRFVELQTGLRCADSGSWLPVLPHVMRMQDRDYERPFKTSKRFCSSSRSLPDLAAGLGSVCPAEALLPAPNEAMRSTTRTLLSDSSL